MHIAQYDRNNKLSKLKQLVKLERFLLNDTVNYKCYNVYARKIMCQWQFSHYKTHMNLTRIEPELLRNTTYKAVY